MPRIQGMRATYEHWLLVANDGLHMMRRCGADSMIDFSIRDPESFCIMVSALKGLDATITPEVDEAWQKLKERPPICA